MYRDFKTIRSNRYLVINKDHLPILFDTKHLVVTQCLRHGFCLFLMEMLQTYPLTEHRIIYKNEEMMNVSPLEDKSSPFASDKPKQGKQNSNRESMSCFRLPPVSYSFHVFYQFFINSSLSIKYIQ